MPVPNRNRNTDRTSLLGIRVRRHRWTGLLAAALALVLAAGSAAAAVSAPPTVAVPATAVESADGTMILLSALGADDGGEANLRYTWSAVAAPAGARGTVGENGTNAAKSTSATVTALGTYVVRVTITDADGQSATSDATVTMAARRHLSPPRIAPPGGTFAGAVGVSISSYLPSVLPLTGVPFGVKHPGAGVETGQYLSLDGSTPAAIRLATSADAFRQFPGAAVQPGWGPFYVWSLRTLVPAAVTRVTPGSRWGFTDSTTYDGNRFDFFHGQTGNRVFVKMQVVVDRPTLADVDLRAVAAGVDDPGTASHQLANFGTIALADMAVNGLQIDLEGNRARVRFGLAPLRSAATDAAGWAVYTGDAASGRPQQPLVASRQWIQLDGNYDIAPRELVIAPTPRPAPPVLRYTTDGSAVDGSSPVYTVPFTVASPATVHARVEIPGFLPSADAVAVYVLPGGNQAPTVATPAHASPDPVTGTGTTLSVLGADDGGEGALSYTWSEVSGPPGVVFGASGGNAAKTTTATFAAPGSYVLRATIADAPGQTAISDVAVTVVATPVETLLTVSPPAAVVPVHGTRTFTATAHDQFGQPIAPAWSVSGGGTIDGAGVFTAGASAGGPFTVTATAGSLVGTAAVTVSADQPPVVTITAPAPGAVLTSTPVAVGIQVTSPSPIEEVRANSVLVARPQSTSFTGSTLLNLADGQQTIVVTAVNTAGLSAQASVVVTVAAQPLVIAILQPADGMVATDQNVYVTARVTSPTAAVTINGQVATRIGFLAAAWVHLAPGANTITAVVTEAGRSGSDAVAVAFSPAPGYDPAADSDGDGVPDGVDLFPHDPGNSTDRDNDGTGDGSDPAPDDPNIDSSLIITSPVAGQTIHASY